VTSVVVRAATDDDLPGLARIFRSASLSNPGDRAALLRHPEVLELPADLVSAGHTVVATVDGAGVVGFATARPTARDVLELDDLFVDPEWMRRGVARELIRALLVRARLRGISRIEVTANEHAADFYHASGFVPAGRATTRFGTAPRLRHEVTDETLDG